MVVPLDRLSMVIVSVLHRASQSPRPLSARAGGGSLRCR
jgi:hypothetical protein